MKRKGLITLATVLVLGMAATTVHAAESADQNPPDATEETYKPFHANLDEDTPLIETEADIAEENATTYPEVKLDATNFPDEDFRNFIADTCDTNKDDILQSDEIRAAKELSTDYEVYFSSAKGIEHLKNLKKFSAPMAGFSAIDVSQNTKLQILEIGSNEDLASIDVSNNKVLRILDISGSKIATIDVSNNPELRWLFAFDCPMTSVDVSHNAKLKRLDMARTQLTSIDVTNNPKLQALNIEKTNVTSIDTSKNRDLYEFYFQGTNISSVDFTKNWNLAQVWASGTKLTSLDVSHCHNLWVLYIQDLPELKEVDFSKCPALYELYASNSGLEKLDLSTHTILNCVEINGTKIKELDIRNSKDINGLNISDTPITSIDLSQNTELKRLELKNTPIRQLDLSQNKALKKLYIDNTNIENLKDLDLSTCEALEEVGCSNAGIESLILPANSDLCYVDCSNNHLKELDLSKAPMLWWELKYSPQNINTTGELKNGKICVDLKQYVSDLSKVTIAPSEDYTYDAENGLLTFADPSAAHFTYSYAHGYKHDATAEPMTVQANIDVAYKVLNGGNQTITPGSSLTFQCNGTKNLFQGIAIDQVSLSSDHYTVTETEEGLTFVISKEALDAVASGEHKIVVAYENGVAELTFTKADNKPATPSTPTDSQKPSGNKKPANTVATGDSAAVIPFMILLVLSFSVFAVTFRKKLTNR